MKNKGKTEWRDPKDYLYPSRHPSVWDASDEIKRVEEDLYGRAEVLKARIASFLEQLEASDHPLKKQKVRALKRLLASFT